MNEVIYTNCMVVTKKEVFRGTIVVKNGIIKDVEDLISSDKAAIDL